MLVPVEGTSFFAYVAPNSALAPGSLAILAAIRRASSLVSMSPLLAQSGYRDTWNQCPLLGVKRTSIRESLMSAFDPKRTSQAFHRCY